MSQVDQSTAQTSVEPKTPSTWAEASRRARQLGAASPEPGLAAVEPAAEAVPTAPAPGESGEIFTPIPVPEPTPAANAFPVSDSINPASPDMVKLPTPPTPPPGLDVPVPPLPPIPPAPPVLSAFTAIVPSAEFESVTELTGDHSVTEDALGPVQLSFLGAPDLQEPTLEPLELPSEEELRKLVNEHSLPESGMPVEPVTAVEPVAAEVAELPPMPPPPPALEPIVNEPSIDQPPVDEPSVDEPSMEDDAVRPPLPAPPVPQAPPVVPVPVAEASDPFEDGPWPGSGISQSADEPAWDQPVPTLIAPESQPAPETDEPSTELFSTPPPDAPIPTADAPSMVYAVADPSELPPPPPAAPFAESQAPTHEWPGSNISQSTDEPSPSLFINPPPEAPFAEPQAPAGVWPEASDDSATQNESPFGDFGPNDIGETPLPANPATPMGSWPANQIDDISPVNQEWPSVPANPTIFGDVPPPPETDQDLIGQPWQSSAPTQAAPQPTEQPDAAVEELPAPETNSPEASSTADSFFQFVDPDDEPKKKRRASMFSKLLARKPAAPADIPTCPSCAGPAQVDIDTASVDNRHLSCNTCSAMWTEPRDS